MPGVVVAVVAGGLFFLGYRYYSRYIAERVYALDPNFVTPSHEFEDGVDYVPTYKHVLFGHHFTSVAGAAPIVGPAIAVFWGWLPALLWVVLGIIFFLLTMVNAVFAVVIAILFEANPGAVIPIFGEIPIAIFIGQYVYRTRTSALGPSLLGVATLYLLILVGREVPIEIDGLAEAFGIGTRTAWVIIMFVYAAIASRIPVWLLLQPRDYINSHQLFIALGVIFLGLLIGMNEIVAPAVRSDIPEGSPNWFPFLFVTIACGAISGFHSLVSSGTTSKQLDKETDARYVGYMGAIGEGSLATGSVLAATAGVATLGAWQEGYVDFPTASAGGIGAFVAGVGEFVSNLGIPDSLGIIFASVVVISFAATTMDTGVRLQRYIIQEIGDVARIRGIAKNLNVATALAVGIPLVMAVLPGR